MGLNNRRPWDLCFWLALALAGLLCSGGVNSARSAEVTGTIGPAPGAAAPGAQEDRKTSLALDPFYVLREDAARVQVQRLHVTLELHPQFRQTVDIKSPRLREQLYDFLTSKKAEGMAEGLEQRALVELVNRFLGQEAVAAVKVDRSILLLR